MNTDILPYSIRVERGSLNDHEAAALVAVLLALTQAGTPAAAGSPGLGPGRGGARWGRLERTRGFHGPRSWQGLR